MENKLSKKILFPNMPGKTSLDGSETAFNKSPNIHHLFFIDW